MATSRRFIVSDTSILLSFVCANKHDLLIKFAGPNPIYLPQVVVDEMERKLSQPKFRGAHGRWMRLLSSKYFAVLEETAELLPIIRGFAGYAFSYQGGKAKNLGEFMSLAHCIHEQDRGRKVAMLVDDGDAREIARKRSVHHFGSEQVLLRAVQQGHIKNRADAKKIWEQLRAFDTHVPFEETALASPATYS